MLKKTAGAVNIAVDFVLDTFKKVILFVVLVPLAVIGFLTSMSALAYHIAK